MVTRQRGFTLLEVVVSLVAFGAFLWIIVLLTAEMRGLEKRMPVNFMSHPQVGAVLSRLRKDVQDATAPFYLDSYQTWTRSPTVLIVYSLQKSGYAETIVWEFKPSEVIRHAYSVGNETSTWTARQTPTFTKEGFDLPQGPVAVRIKAYDDENRLAVDQIFQPRTH